MSKTYRTKGKEILFAYFEALNGKRFCAKDVMEYLKEKGESMNQATVYRNLDKLSSDGILFKSKQPDDDNTYYQYVGENSHCNEHLHMQCKNCGKVIHLESPKMDIFYKQIHDEMGFELEPVESVLVGVCADCKYDKN